MCVGFIFWDVEINNDFEDITQTSYKLRVFNSRCHAQPSPIIIKCSGFLSTGTTC
jgi:hypothetical protein